MLMAVVYDMEDGDEMYDKLIHGGRHHGRIGVEVLNDFQGRRAAEKNRYRIGVPLYAFGAPGAEQGQKINFVSKLRVLCPQGLAEL